VARRGALRRIFMGRAGVLRGGVRTHNAGVAGSSPAPATYFRNHLDRLVQVVSHNDWRVWRSAAATYASQFVSTSPLPQAILPQTLCDLLPQADAQRIMGKSLGGRTFKVIAPGEDRASQPATAVAKVILPRLDS